MPRQSVHALRALGADLDVGITGLVSRDPGFFNGSPGLLPAGRIDPTRLLPFFFALGSASCGDATGAPSLVSSRAAITLSTAQPVDTLTLRGSTRGEWRVTVAPGWIRVTPQRGMLGADTLIAVAAPGLADLMPGGYSGDIVFASDRLSVAVRVSAVVGPRPRLTLSATLATIGEGTDTTSVELTNQGNAPASWRLTPDVPWLSALPATGRLERQERVLLHVRAAKAALPVGTSEGTLSFMADALAEGVALPVKVAVAAVAVARFDVARLLIPRGIEAVQVTLDNPGRAPLAWSVARAPGWLAVRPAAGSLDGGAQVSITASVDRLAAPAGEWRDTLTLATNAGAAVLPIVLADAGPVVGALWRLPDAIEVARYDRGKDRVVALTADGAALLILDMSAGITDRVTLTRVGKSLALTPSGRRAVVGDDAYATVVDLDSRTVSGSFQAGRVRRAALTDAGWIYTFPRYGTWDNLRSVNTVTGEESKDPWLIYESFGKVHPSGAYLYATNGWSLEKWDVSAGPAHFMYESPIYGAYGDAGDVWFAEDGSRLYTASRHVFLTSPEADWTPVGELPVSFTIGSLAEARAPDRVYVLATGQVQEWWAGSEPFRGDAAVITVIDATTLAGLGTIALPPFEVPDGSGGTARHPSVGRYVFVDGAGRRIYALVQAPAAAGLTADWAVATFDVASTP